MKKTLVQFVKFGIVGVSNTIVYYAVYALAYAICDNYLFANMAGWLISVLNAFFWQTRYVFVENQNEEKRIWWKVLLKTYAAYAFTGLVLNNILLYVWMDILHVENYIAFMAIAAEKINISLTTRKLAGYLAPVLNMGVSIPVNFIINKFWAYRQKK